MTSKNRFSVWGLDPRALLARRRAYRRADRSVKLEKLLALEPRQLLTTAIVMNTDDSGPGSLRDAILSTNSGEGPHIINFEIPGSGVQTITPLTPLPALTGNQIINGNSQPDYANSPLIVISGTSAGAGANGLDVQSQTVIVGLDIINFGGNGILLDVGSDDSNIEGNYLGVDATGSTAAGNLDGISIFQSASNTLSGNLISGNMSSGVYLGNEGVNSAYNLLIGNSIGINAAGTGAVPNDDGIDDFGELNSIGEDSSLGPANVISGNDEVGIRLETADATSNTIANDDIGTDPSGMYRHPQRQLRHRDLGRGVEQHRGRQDRQRPQRALREHLFRRRDRRRGDLGQPGRGQLHRPERRGHRRPAERPGGRGDREQCHE